MELVTSIVGGEAPRDGTVLSIALGLQGGDALAQVLHACHTTRQTATSKDTDLDLGHIQPTAMFGCIVKLHPLQNAAGLLPLQGFIQRWTRMGIVVMLHDADLFNLLKDLINQREGVKGVKHLIVMLLHL